MEADRTRFCDVYLSCNTKEPRLHWDSYSNFRMQTGWSTGEYVVTVNPNVDRVFPTM